MYNMQQELNIVDLIEKNPITRLSSSYNGKLLTKIKDCFTEFEQQIFVSSFYCYLNYDKSFDFIIDLGDLKTLESIKYFFIISPVSTPSSIKCVVNPTFLYSFSNNAQYVQSIPL